ncbi:MAG: peptide ABC transporter substrate-binding protein [Mycobacterium leprae]
MKQFKYVKMLAVLAGLSTLLVACGGAKTSTQPAAAAGGAPTTTFHYYIVDKPTTFDPAMVSDVPTSQVIQNIYSGLVTFNDKGEVVNDMADKVDISADGKTYTFTLKDAYFTDGTKVTAQDYVRSIVRAENPALNSPVASSYLNDIAGYHDFLDKQDAINKDVDAKKISKDDATKQIQAAYDAMTKNPGISAKDDKTLVINIDQPRAYFLAKLTYPTAWPVSPKAPADKPIDASPANVSVAVGTGAFSLTGYTEGAKLTLKRNDKFYGDKALVGNVDIQIISSDQAQMAAYRAGQLDMSPIPPTDFKTVKADPTLGKEVVVAPSARINYFTFNQKVFAPAQDLKIRQAFNYAIDRDKLNDVVFSGTMIPAYGVLPAAIPGSLGDKVQGLKFDVNKANDLLKQAGYGEGGKQLSFKLTYRAKNETAQHLAEFLQSQFQTNLKNVKVDLDPMEWGKLLNAADAKDQLQAFLLGWSADYLDPQDFLSILLHTGSDSNNYNYSNKQFDAILDKADVAKPGADRYAMYGQAEQIAVTDAAWSPLYYNQQLYVVKSFVKGMQINGMGVMPLNHVSVNK